MQIHVVDHPLIKEKMTRLRDKNTQPKDFRQLLDQIAQLLLFEVTRDLPVRHKKVTTPLAETTGYELDVSGITVVPILRAGLGFLMRSWTLCRKPKWAILALPATRKRCSPSNITARCLKTRMRKSSSSTHARYGRQCRSCHYHAQAGWLQTFSLYVPCGRAGRGCPCQPQPSGSAHLYGSP